MSARGRQFILFLAAAVLVGHAVLIVIASPTVIMCGFDIVCLTTTFKAFPITGVLSEGAFEDLEVLNRATGMTGNAVGSVSGYALTCFATAICVFFRSDPVRTRVFAASTAVTSIVAVAIYIRGGVVIAPLVRRETLEFLAQNTTPLVLVSVAAVYILAATPSRPQQPAPRLQWRSRLLAGALYGTSLVLALLSVAELVVAMLIFSPLAGNTVLTVVAGERLDVTAVMHTPRCTASVLCGMLVLQVVAATDRLRPRALLAFSSATFHLANWFTWLVVISDLERGPATDMVTGLGAGATAVVVFALVMYAIDDRQHLRAQRAHESQTHDHELLLLSRQEREQHDSDDSTIGAVPPRQRLQFESDSESSAVDFVPSRQRLK